MNPNPDSRLRAWKAISAFALPAVIVIALDLWTKDAIFKFLRVESVGDPPRVARQAEFIIIPGFFDLQANYNYGAFSGLFREHTGILSAVSALAIAVIAGIFIAQFRRGRTPGLVFSLSLGLLLGGTTGNLYDRAVLGAVRDWVKWFFVVDGREYVWPNFNVADSAICVGVGLLIFSEIWSALRAKRS